MLISYAQHGKSWFTANNNPQYVPAYNTFQMLITDMVNVVDPDHQILPIVQHFQTTDFQRYLVEKIQHLSITISSYSISPNQNDLIGAIETTNAIIFVLTEYCISIGAQLLT